MSELRAKQRQKRELAIINAAVKLINEKGYRNTTVEEIASLAEVGPVTFYNYFGSKSEFLVTLVSRYTEIVLKTGEAVIKNSPLNAEDAVFALLKGYLGNALKEYNAKLLREILAAVFIEQLVVRKKMMEIDHKITRQVVELLSRFKESGQLNPNLEVSQAAMHLYVTVLSWLMVLIMDDEMDVDMFLDTVKRQIHIAFVGIGTHT
jgi:AcrR family transcriptional regulator